MNFTVYELYLNKPDLNIYTEMMRDSKWFTRKKNISNTKKTVLEEMRNKGDVRHIEKNSKMAEVSLSLSAFH